MTFGSIDFKDTDEDLGRRSPDEKKLEKRKHLNPENLTSGDVLVNNNFNVDTLDPEDLLVLMEEGKIPRSAVYDFQKPENKKLGSNLKDFELEPESDDELTINSSSEPSDVETIVAEKEVEEIISKSKEEALSKERAALISKKRDDEFSDIESHGKRGKEHKGKFKKGLESIKRLLKIK